MEYRQFRCKGCEKLHRLRAADQKYCGVQTCQRKRKNEWRREHYATDIEYRLTAQASTAAWLETQGGAARYHRNYRQRQKRRRLNDDGRTAEPVRAERGARARQSGTVAPDANSDAKNAQVTVSAGRYLLVPSGGANSDAILVELRAITGDFRESQRTTELAGQTTRVNVGT